MKKSAKKKSAKKWRSFEMLGHQIVKDLSRHLRVGNVVMDAQADGVRSGNAWNVEVLAEDIDNGQQVIVECRFQGKPMSREAMGGFAYRVIDTDASKGIIFHRKGYQKGAAKIIDAEPIVAFTVTEGSDADNYVVLEISNKLRMHFVKMTDELPALHDSFGWVRTDLRTGETQRGHVDG